jgi:hypothetical protein
MRAGLVIARRHRWSDPNDTHGECCKEPAPLAEKVPLEWPGTFEEATPRLRPEEWRSAADVGFGRIRTPRFLGGSRLAERPRVQNETHD